MNRSYGHIVLSVSLPMDLILGIDQKVADSMSDRSKVIVALLRDGLKYEQEQESIRLAKQVAMDTGFVDDIEKI